MIYLPFCIHNHQPAGNFDFVLEDAYKQSYWPFLKLLHEFPGIKMTIHNTGFLLDWIATVHPEYIELLSIMVNRGQVEVMGGGFFEPILAVIPDKDRVAQIQMMSELIEDLFDVRPAGLWLAERVWEPTLPTSLNKAGVEYVLVDDFHFIKAGLTREELGGYYITEDRGRSVKVFPGSEALRYLIPFRTVPELKAHLQGLGGELKGGNAAIYGDDGEKFGVWPGTHKLVFKDNWLKRFFQMIVDTEGVTPVTLGEYAAMEKPLGRVYLPTCSYMEMGEWSLAPQAGRDYSALMESFKDNRGGTRFIQGGTWRGFFAKYPESNWMHKRMLMASALLHKKRSEKALPKETLDKAALALYASQCNDAYWHGIFGGLYLPHLRTEVYRNILKCESLLTAESGAGEGAERVDVDADGLPEIIVSSADSRLFISPEHGGAAFELDSLSLGINAMNVLTRWPEGYHHKVLALDDGDGTGGVQSIHDSVKSKEKNIKRFLVTDSHRKGSLVDRFIPCDETMDSFVQGNLVDDGDFADAPYGVMLDKEGLELSRSASVGNNTVSITKDIQPHGSGGFALTSTLSPSHPGQTRLPAGYSYGLEFNILLPGCDGPRSCFEVTSSAGALERAGLKKPHEFHDVRTITVGDGFTGAAFSLSLDAAAARIWSTPIYTVTLSEAGFERCFQGSSLLLLFPIESAGEADAVFNLRFSLHDTASS